jgi:hypothetical protein
MKKIMLAVLMMVLLAMPVQAQIDPTLITISETAYSVNVLSGVSSLTGGTPYAVSAVVQVQGGPIRYYLNGTNPTTKTGFVAYDGDFLPVFTPYDVQGLRFIADSTAASGLGTTVYGVLKGRR